MIVHFEVTIKPKKEFGNRFLDDIKPDLLVPIRKFYAKQFGMNEADVNLDLIGWNATLDEYRHYYKCLVIVQVK